jgi:hypothetical protein
MQPSFVQTMTYQAVSLKVTPCLHIECKFWLTDDGWNGSSDESPAVVQASSFEQAKSDTQLGFGKAYRETLAREWRKQVRTGGVRTLERKDSATLLAILNLVSSLLPPCCP